MKLFELFGTIAVKTDDAERDIDAMTSKAENASKDIDGAFSGLGNIAKAVGAAAVGVGAAFVGAVGGLAAFANANQELVENVGKLETAFKDVEGGVATAHESYQTFMGLLGDSDTATEASQLLASLSKNGEDIDKWYTISAGALASFGDALPIEGLIESANETARVGTVTGSLADALNWTSASADTWRAAFGDNTEALHAFEKASASGMSAEEAFNEALKTCRTEQERAALITMVMSGLYGDLGEEYEKTNAKVIAAREAQAKLDVAMSNAAEAAMPLSTGLSEIGTTILENVTPYLESFASWFSEKLPEIQSALDSAFAFMGETVVPKLTNAFTWLKDNVLPGLQTGFQWFVDNLPVLGPLFLGVAVGIAAFQIATHAAGWVTALKTAFQLLNTTLKANAVYLIVSAVIGLVVWLGTLWATNEDFRNKVTELWEGLKTWWTETIETISTTVSGWIEGFKAWWEQLKTDATTKWEELKTAITTKFEEIKTAISEKWEAFKALFNWDNIKETASAKWEEIKSAVGTKVSEMSTALSTAWEGVKTTASTKWDELKTNASTKWEEVKSAIGTKVAEASGALSTAWTGIKDTASTKWEELKTTADTKWQEVQSFMEDPIGNAVTAISGFLTDIGLDFSGFDSASINTLFTSIGGFISDPIGTAKDTVDGFISDIQGFFDGLDFSLPSIELPHFNVSVPSWNPLDWADPALRPSLSVDWYAKGGIFDQPTIFPTASGFKGVGEAGPEAVTPIGVLQTYVSEAVRAENELLVGELQRLTGLLAQYLPELLEASSKPMYLDGDALVGAIGDRMDEHMGRRYARQARGLA